jgi:phytoene/squalene synthetase
MTDSENFDYLKRQAREFEPDYFYAALLAPRDAQHDLIVLAAYVAETACISTSVQEPALAEIRVQWWRDALADAVVGTRSGNPVLDALADVVSRRGVGLHDASLPLEAIDREIEGAPFQSDEDLRTFLDQGSGAVARMALKITAPGAAMGDEASFALTQASQAIGAIRLARRLAELIRHGRCPFPPGSGDLDDSMSETTVRQGVASAAQTLASFAIEQWAGARQGLYKASASQRAAVLPGTLTQAYAAQLRSPAHNALQDRVDIAPLNRLLRLWWFARTGRS